MSIKENIEMVKEELNSEEKFFEKAVITEKFVKKYKKPLIGAVVAVVLFASANILYEGHKQSQIENANNLLAQLQNDQKNDKLLKELDSISPKLHDAWVLSLAIADKDIDKLKTLQKSKADLVEDIASYEVAQLSKDVDLLNDYASKESSIYKDLARIQSAVLLLNQNKTKLAHEKLSSIPETSPLGNIALALSHYGVK
jgi:hypothetical protein